MVILPRYLFFSSSRKSERRPRFPLLRASRIKNAVLPRTFDFLGFLGSLSMTSRTKFRIGTGALERVWSLKNSNRWKRKQFALAMYSAFSSWTNSGNVLPIASSLMRR